MNTSMQLNVSAEHIVCSKYIVKEMGGPYTQGCPVALACRDVFKPKDIYVRNGLIQMLTAEGEILKYSPSLELNTQICNFDYYNTFEPGTYTINQLC